MFNLFKKKTIQKKKIENHFINDKMEKSLWDIKEVYDLETEEVERVVIEKRNFELLRNEIK
tara:strand:- start:1152 stop:1334 length:183 start_codon:yes stop_codon:yes gene_type:complete